MLLLVLSAVLILAFTIAASRNAQMVPGRLQFAGETVYGFVRNTLARDNIGSEHFMKFVPYLFTLFIFILVNNYFGIIPFIQFPTIRRGSASSYRWRSSRWVIYIGVGIWKHGVFGYLKHATMPSGVGGPILILLVPLEFFSNILVRPVTLTLRLFGNMFAGHLLLILFATGGAALLTSGNLLYARRRHPVLRPRHRRQLPGDAGDVPAGVRLHPAQLDVHRGSARRRALIHPHKFRQTAARWTRRRRKEKPWKAPST